MPKVFIIILHYKNWGDTQECLKSLEALNYDNFEVIVVDNGSKDKFTVHSPRFTVKQIFNKENLGFAGGMNVGIGQALKKDAKYILLLNNDVTIEPNFLKELVRKGESDRGIGILGPVIYDYQSKKIHFAGGKINWLYTKGIHIQNTRYPSLAKRSGAGKIRYTDYITGACLLIKREVIEKIGLMDEDYFLYFEDVDWCLKARRAGYKCVLIPNSKIWHKPSSSAKEGSFSYIYYHTRNGLLMTKKNALFLIKFLAYLQSFWIFGKQIIKLMLMPSKKKWARAMMLGIKDFYRGKFGKL